MWTKFYSLIQKDPSVIEQSVFSKLFWYGDGMYYFKDENSLRLIHTDIRS